MVPMKDSSAVDPWAQTFGMENNGERSNAVGRVGEIVLPDATDSEHPLDTRPVRDILSASVPDFADHEM